MHRRRKREEEIAHEKASAEEKERRRQAEMARLQASLDEEDRRKKIRMTTQTQSYHLRHKNTF